MFNNPKEIKGSNNKYYITCGNHRSKQNYNSYDNANIHLLMDKRACQMANNITEANDLSPIVWIPIAEANVN